MRNKNRDEELRALGADEIIDVTSEDVVARVKAITGDLAKYCREQPKTKEAKHKFVAKPPALLRRTESHCIA